MTYKTRLHKGVQALENAYDELSTASSERVAYLLGGGDIVVGAVAFSLDLDEDDLINAAIELTKNRKKV